MVAGVAAGLGRWIGVDAVVVRLAFIVLSFAGGFGVVLYLFGRFLIPEADGTEPAPRPGTPRGALALMLVVVGLLLFLRGIGWWTADVIVWPLTVAAIGSGLVWTRSSGRERARWARLAGRIAGPQDGAELARRPGPVAVLRGLLGGALVVGGMVAILAGSDAFVNLEDLVVSAVVLGGGFVLLLGPLVLRLTRQLGEERRERIRSEERAEVAAHLHDSVLQTLALIQRSSDQAESVRLARSQERELRTWLFGKPQDLAGRRLVAAVEAAAAAVEERVGIPIEVVAVGDCDLDEHLRALVTAAAEGMANAARHSGAPVVTVYLEVDPEHVVLYVRDEGSGFVEAAVPPDRKGVSQSIRERMERHGGTADIDSAPGEGTEVELRMPRRPAPTPPADAAADEPEA